MESEKMGLKQYIFLTFVMTVFVDCTDVMFDTHAVHRVVGPKYVNVAIESGIIRKHWEQFQPKSTKVKTLAAGLAPCYMRVGGTEADFLIFRNDKRSKGKVSDWLLKDRDNIQIKQYLKANVAETQTRSKRDVGLYDTAVPLTNFTMTASFYDQIHEFVSSVGWDLTFDLNSLLRKPDGSWDPSNAVELINYTIQSGYKMGGWELGNEPNAYYHNIGIRVEPEQLAKDFISLHKLLVQYAQFEDTQLLGPSVTQLNKTRTNSYFGSFLSSGGGDVVTAATWHHYYVHATTAKIEDFYNRDILNTLHDEIQTGVNLTQAAGSRAKMWLGETSSAVGGGAPGLSDRFVAGFMWLDKLGMSARDGLDAVIRQAFYGGHYSLLDRLTLDPNPDYWLTLLYKLLVGNRVLRVMSPDSSGELRVYAHCTETRKSGYPVGTVTVYVMNLGDSVRTVSFSQFPVETLHVYNMAPPDNDLLSQYVMLNGVILRMKDEKTLPDLLRPVKTTRSVDIQAKTFSFLVIPDANLSVCM